MKVYRCVDFSKLIFLQDEVGRVRWNNYHQDKIQNGEQENFNWWFDSNYLNKRRELISRITTIEEAKNNFIQKSIIHNSLQGGRFNPAKSFGGIYIANNPLVACMEVLFHIFYDSYPIYKGLEKNESKIASCFDLRIPDKIKSLIIAFELEVEEPDNKPIHKLNDSLKNLKEDCQKIGFRRYIGDNFDRNFIYGNDYEISRILGCHLYTKESSFFSTPSARLDISLQDQLDLRNYFLPEKDIDDFKPKLTGNFLEFLCTVDMVQNENRHHDIKIDCEGQNEKKTYQFGLQEIPEKKNPRNAIVYEPSGVSIQDQRLYSRRVDVQRYVFPKDEE